jgi:hypothetical protein
MRGLWVGIVAGWLRFMHQRPSPLSRPCASLARAGAHTESNGRPATWATAACQVPSTLAANRHVEPPTNREAHSELAVVKLDRVDSNRHERLPGSATAGGLARIAEGTRGFRPASLTQQ